jgi:hypothetical protein
VAASKSLRSIPPNAKNHSFRFEEIPQRKFARKLMPEPQFPANQIPGIRGVSIVDQALRDISRTTTSTSKQKGRMALCRSALRFGAARG